MIRKTNLRQKLARVVNAFVRQPSQPFPAGQGAPLPPVPTVTEPTPDEVEEALKEWDKLMPEYRGLLEATIRRKDARK